jgi:hypothetical protein
MAEPKLGASSVATIFLFGGMNKDIAFSNVVFPLAIGPPMSIVDRYETSNHKYAAASYVIVSSFKRSITVRGSSVLLLIVKVVPLLDTTSRVK